MQIRSTPRPLRSGGGVRGEISPARRPSRKTAHCARAAGPRSLRTMSCLAEQAKHPVGPAEENNRHLALKEEIASHVQLNARGAARVRPGPRRRSGGDRNWPWQERFTRCFHRGRACTAVVLVPPATARRQTTCRWGVLDLPRMQLRLKLTARQIDPPAASRSRTCPSSPCPGREPYAHAARRRSGRATDPARRALRKGRLQRAPVQPHRPRGLGPSRNVLPGQDLGRVGVVGLAARACCGCRRICHMLLLLALLLRGRGRLPASRHVMGGRERGARRPFRGSRPPCARPARVPGCPFVGVWSRARRGPRARTRIDGTRGHLWETARARLT